MISYMNPTGQLRLSPVVKEGAKNNATPLQGRSKREVSALRDNVEPQSAGIKNSMAALICLKVMKTVVDEKDRSNDAGIRFGNSDLSQHLPSAIYVGGSVRIVDRRVGKRLVRER